MTIKIEMLRAFRAVAETGTLADAASHLGRTPSALSMTLKKLEDHLGQRLFETDRKTRLTPLGRYVLDQARREVSQFDRTVAAIEEYARAETGLLRVACVPSLSARLIPPAVERITRRFPGLRLELRDMDSAAIRDGLSRGQIEVGLCTAQTPLQGVAQEPLCSDAFGLVCGCTHPLAREAEVARLSDLAAYRFLGNALCGAIPDPGIGALQADAPVAAHNTLTLVEMLRAGDWITLLPEAVVALAPNDLVFRPIRGMDAQRNVHVMWRMDGPDDAAVGAMVDTLKSVAR